MVKNVFPRYYTEMVGAPGDTDKEGQKSRLKEVQCSAVLSAIKAYNGYHPCHRVLWMNPAANITFSVITLETARI